MTDFGGKLRQARERRGISLRQIAASTKISVAALEALERNDMSKLPGGIFSRAFVRSYAIEVGLDPDETVREFLERLQSDEAAAAAAPRQPIPEEESQFESQQRMAGVVLRLVLVAIPIVIAILYFTLRSRSEPVADVPAPQPAAAAEPVPEQPHTAAPAETPPAPVVPAAPTPAAPAAAVSAGAIAAGPVAGTVQLDLHPSAECWVSLSVDGQRVFARVMQPGEHSTHTVRREAVAEVGDAGAFAYSINGREGQPLGTKGQVKTLRVTPGSARD